MLESKRIKSTPLKIEGVFGLKTHPKIDERGSLTRLWEEDLIISEFNMKQMSVVNNHSKLTLRGLHYQISPHLENKIIYCIVGKIFEVVLDLRDNSNTYGKHLTLETGPNSNFQGLVVPSGCAHGYMTLARKSNLIYLMDNVYLAESARGVLWNDPDLDIKWPSKPRIISRKDLSWPQFKNL